MDKIGRGNFGDVYRANLHIKGKGSKSALGIIKGRGKNILSVAAKTCKVRYEITFRLMISVFLDFISHNVPLVVIYNKRLVYTCILLFWIGYLA